MPISSGTEFDQFMDRRYAPDVDPSGNDAAGVAPRGDVFDADGWSYDRPPQDDRTVTVTIEHAKNRSGRVVSAGWFTGAQWESVEFDFSSSRVICWRELPRPATGNAVKGAW